MTEGNLFTAPAKAQAEFPTIKKTKTATVRGTTKEGKSYNYDFEYADLADVLAAVRPILGKHGIAITQQFSDQNIVTQLHFGDQAFEAGSYPVRSKNPDDPVKYAGAVTFARRYSLNIALGLHADTLDADDFQGEVGRDSEPRDFTQPPRSASIEDVTITAKNAETWAKRWINLAANCTDQHGIETLWDLTKQQRDEVELLSPSTANTFRTTYDAVLARFTKDAA